MLRVIYAAVSMQDLGTAGHAMATAADVLTISAESQGNPDWRLARLGQSTSSPVGWGTQGPWASLLKARRLKQANLSLKLCLTHAACCMRRSSSCVLTTTHDDKTMTHAPHPL